MHSQADGPCSFLDVKDYYEICLSSEPVTYLLFFSSLLSQSQQDMLRFYLLDTSTCFSSSCPRCVPFSIPLPSKNLLFTINLYFLGISFEWLHFLWINFFLYFLSLIYIFKTQSPFWKWSCYFFFFLTTLPSVTSGNSMRDINRLRQKEFPNLDHIQKVLDFPVCKLETRINDQVFMHRHV